MILKSQYGVQYGGYGPTNISIKNDKRQLRNQNIYGCKTHGSDTAAVLKFI